MKILLLFIIWLGAAGGLFEIWNLVAADQFFAVGMGSGRLEAFTKAVELNPLEETYWRNLGLAAAVSEEGGAANTYFEEALRLNPDNILTLKTALMGYKALGKVEQAQKILKQLQERIPTDPSVFDKL